MGLGWIDFSNVEYDQPVPQVNTVVNNARIDVCENVAPPTGSFNYFNAVSCSINPIGGTNAYAGNNQGFPNNPQPSSGVGTISIAPYTAALVAGNRHRIEVTCTATDGSASTDSWDIGYFAATSPQCTNPGQPGVFVPPIFEEI